MRFSLVELLLVITLVCLFFVTKSQTLVQAALLPFVAGILAQVVVKRPCIESSTFGYLAGIFGASIYALIKEVLNWREPQWSFYWVYFPLASFIGFFGYCITHRVIALMKTVCGKL
ncbi:MAG: hypothetical protein KDA60_09155 [Planctomycetales bacterium]|nr:hypothetical protein [Planctomycetales bacterium]